MGPHSPSPQSSPCRAEAAFPEKPLQATGSSFLKSPSFLYCYIKPLSSLKAFPICISTWEPSSHKQNHILFYLGRKCAWAGAGGRRVGV